MQACFFIPLFILQADKQQQWETAGTGKHLSLYFQSKQERNPSVWARSIIVPISFEKAQEVQASWFPHNASSQKWRPRRTSFTRLYELEMKPHLQSAYHSLALSNPSTNGSL